MLITVSGTIPVDACGDSQRGVRPRADYDRLAAAMNADLIDYAAAHRAGDGLIWRAAGKVGGDSMLLAMAVFRRRNDYQVVFTDSEKVGMLFAALCLLGRRNSRHVMIAHRLSPSKKRLFHRVLGLRRRIDHVLVYAAAQHRVAIDQLGYEPECVTLTPFMVDTTFWDPAQATARPRRRPLICAAGRELRDYPTLFEAVGALDVDLIVTTASAWSKRADSTSGTEVPSNVEVTQVSLTELRQLYRDASLVAVPLAENDFQAGVTAILEAMAMGLPVVCTRTTGQTDVIVDGITGVYVPPGDPEALRGAIESLLADEERRTALGSASRRWAVANADVDVYASRLAAITTAVDAGRSANDGASFLAR